MFVAAFPGFRHLQEFLRASGMVALQRATLRRYGASLALNPCFSHVNDQSSRFGFLLELASSERKSHLLEIHAHLAAQEILRRSFRSRALQRGSRLRLGNFVLVADNLPARAHAHPKLFFLPRPEKPHVPIPDVQLAGHQPVGLL